MKRRLLVTLAVSFAASCATHTASEAATAIVNEVAVNSSGKPVNGYHEITDVQSVPDDADCTEPSPAAVSKNIYRCWPAAYAADVCWSAAGLDLLCMNDPWAKELHRIRASAALPQVNPPKIPTPVALTLDDGTRCRLRNGGAWGYRYDDLRGFYACTGRPDMVVLAPMNADPIDRSSPAWSVRVGPGQAKDASSPPPSTHRVQRAWFASN
ncbi:hypothetical protein [Mycobacterium branderi]|uniref:Lipoprotein n=1 Tax=Mycobacterium branderi TaxID=43348 RepID=A0A7I7W4K0_9MYCO|nr:hypothetical protein [Mycobacterium branderi]MCV7233762.1 hypothetical protein [Mycobacterium branderi]ORA39692.1 hypothetical protein BST20_09365 [Mycobacterium branderi]BBZ11725.1 hypothetical protein MBRA_19200 [Mycobacterium branderi]